MVLIITECIFHSISSSTIKAEGIQKVPEFLRPNSRQEDCALINFLTHFNTFTGNIDSGKHTADFEAVLELLSSHTPQPWTEASQREMGKCYLFRLDAKIALIICKSL